MRRIICLAVVASSSLSAADARRGEALFNRKCGGCHALDSEKEGPRLRGVFGRPAASIACFPYSEGLKAARVVWDEATLDKWLADPASVAPDSGMAFRLDNAAERDNIIAYLKNAPGLSIRRRRPTTRPRPKAR